MLSNCTLAWNHSAESAIPNDISTYRWFGWHSGPSSSSDCDTRTNAPTDWTRATVGCGCGCCCTNGNWARVLEHQLSVRSVAGYWTHLKACRRGVSGEPSLIWPKFSALWPFTRHVSSRFLGGSTVSATSLRDCRDSSSSSTAGRRRLRSSSRK